MIDPDTAGYALCGRCYGSMAHDLDGVEYHPGVTWIRRGRKYHPKTCCLLCGDMKSMVTYEHGISALAANQWWLEHYAQPQKKNWS